MTKKIGLIFLGIFLIALFELSLYFTGKIFLYARGLNSQLGNKRFTKLICCIGDSHTFGVGTSYKYSYPKQLEILLNLNNPETAFKVVNLGIPGNSTKQQIERLANFLDKNKVDLAILLTGRNNYYEIKTWKKKSFLVNIVTRIQRMRTYKIVQYLLSRLFNITDMENINAPVEKTRYEDYMRYYLSKAKSLCEGHGSKLLLLSYHNSHNKDIEELAKKLEIPYFNLYKDFFEAIPQEDLDNFVSRDGSHMNHYGYRIFSELLYKEIFLHKEAFDLGLNPLSKRIDEDSFHRVAGISSFRYALGKSIFYEN